MAMSSTHDELLRVVRGRYAESGLTYQQLADRLGTQAGTVSKMMNGQMKMWRWLDQLCDALGIAVTLDAEAKPSDPLDTVPVVAKVGAGEIYYPNSDNTWEAIAHTDAPSAAQGMVAFEVEGRSMEPTYRDRSMVFFRKDVRHTGPELLGEDCVVKVRNGPIYLKMLTKGSRPGFFTLISYSHLQPIVDVEIDWAAPVEWSRRYR